MRIIIPTRGRVGQIETIKHMNEATRAKVTLVVPQEEKDAHNFPNVVAIPEFIKGIAMKRKWIMENIKTPKIIMMDDDLVFNVRKPDSVKLGVAKPEDIENMVNKLEESLDSYAHAGISMRLNNNRTEYYAVEVTRMIRVLAYNRDVFLKEVNMERGLEIAEDFDYALQLFRKGYKNIVYFNWAQGHKGTGTKGGCSIWRTVELHNENMKRLQALHPEFVRLEEKTYEKTKNEMSTRLEAVISWKKAFKEGETNYGAKPQGEVNASI